MSVTSPQRLNLTAFLFVVAVAGLFGSGCNTATDDETTASVLPAKVDFNFHVKPILSDRCFKCHGPDANTREAGMRLDIPSGAFARLKEDSTRFNIKPGSPEESEVYIRITHPDPQERMPHPDSKLSLTDHEIALIKQWIEEGAEWKEHWSFIPPAKPELPDVQQANWPENEIDYFVLARLETEGMKPAEIESKEKWLRRVHFDITGLPPSMKDLEAFQADDSPEAYERMVDQLLASPAYGEHMAAVWLDAARYADSHGYQDDKPRTMWPWRDWVINAYNDNLSYDKFITWQLAGDLLPEATYEQKLATAFNRNHAITQEGGVINEEYVTEYVADRTNTMSTAMMGLTMECARCHDHKYDPISQKDYFQLFAFFNGIDERGQISYFDLAPTPNMSVQDERLETRIEQVAQERADAERALEALVKPSPEYEKWVTEDFAGIDISAGLQEDRMAHFALDNLEQQRTSNNVSTGPAGRINTRLINELAAPEVVAGKSGQAFSFDGENYLNIGDQADFEHSDRFSLSMWVQRTSTPDKLAALLVKRNEEQKRGGYHLMVTKDNRVQAALIHDQGKERIEVTTNASLPQNDWTHLAMSYDGSGKASGVHLYLNGVLQTTAVAFDSLAGQSILNGNDLLIGNWTTRNTSHGGMGGFSEGAIDEVVVYNRELTAVEVQTLAGVDPIKVQTADPLAFYLNRYNKPYQQARHQVDSLRSIHLEVPSIMIMQEMETPRPTHVLARGAYDAPTEQVSPGTPNAVLGFDTDVYPQNRLGLAEWLVDEAHPLTARVAVNRLWQMMFGRGIVSTPEDFGNQGALPSHPELLDWMAVEFRESGWDTKRMMKRMALSATYRQSAHIEPDLYRKDAENILLARGPAQRFSAEMMRDNALHVSGLINDEVGGPWVKPYQPAGVWKELANQIGENRYRPSKGADLYRRGIYSYWKRTIPPPFMLTFDASERAVCVVKRQATSTPLQALVLLNDPQLIEASRKLAERMIEEGGEELEEQLSYGFMLALTRSPDRKELSILKDLFDEEHARFTSSRENALALLHVGESSFNTQFDIPVLAAYTVVANTILNLDEAKMRS